MDKHYSLLGTFVNYGRKKFYNIGPWMMLCCSGLNPVGWRTPWGATWGAKACWGCSLKTGGCGWGWGCSLKTGGCGWGSLNTGAWLVCSLNTGAWLVCSLKTGAWGTGAGCLWTGWGCWGEATAPKAWLPENVGRTTLPWASTPWVTLFTGTGLWLTIPSTASAVLFLGRPLGPGQATQPSWVSLRSPMQVGYGIQVPSWCQHY